MKIPNGMTEAEVVQIINDVVNSVAPQFKFVSIDIDDIKQQGRLEAIKAIEDGKYDPAIGPLKNFLCGHVWKRLHNYRRDNMHRSDPPCIKCPHYDKNYKNSQDQCLAFNCRSECELFRNWDKNNFAKQSVMNPLDIYNINDEAEQNTKFFDNVDDNIDFKELTSKIDIGLPIELRSDYLKMRAGVNIPIGRKNKVREAILNILEGDQEDAED